MVALSDSPLDRRGYSSVCETLHEVEVSETDWLKASLKVMGERCELVDGYEVYSGDSTFIKRSDAQTLAARTMKRLSPGELV